MIKENFAVNCGINAGMERTKIRSTKDKIIAKDLLSKENQYLKIPTEKVFIPK